MSATATGVVVAVGEVRVQSPLASTSPRPTQPSIHPGSVNEEQLECCVLNGRPQIREFITTLVAGYKLDL